MSSEITLPYFFSWNFIWFLQKEPIKVQNFRKMSTAQVKFHQICTLIGSFRCKYIKFQLKKYRGVMSHDTEDLCKIWRKTDLLLQKWQEFCEFWSKHSKVSKLCTLSGPFRATYITFDLKKCRGVVFHDTKESCKIWRNTGLWFGKWHEEFGKLLPEHSKISKICTLMGWFWPKYVIFELRKYRGVMFDDTQDRYKVLREKNLCFQKWHKEFGKISPEHVRKSKNWDFYWVLLSKVEHIWA